MCQQKKTQNSERTWQNMVVTKYNTTENWRVSKLFKTRSQAIWRKLFCFWARFEIRIAHFLMNCFEARTKIIDAFSILANDFSIKFQIHPYLDKNVVLAEFFSKIIIVHEIYPNNLTLLLAIWFLKNVEKVAQILKENRFLCV